MHSATIPIAALATFAAVYWLTPAPAQVVAAEPETALEAAAPAVDGAGHPRPVAVRAAGTRERPRRRPARARRSSVASSDVVRPARRAVETKIYFSGCNEVRAAGLAPLLRGRPGYRPEMDGDDDGLACEARRRN